MAETAKEREEREQREREERERRQREYDGLCSQKSQNDKDQASVQAKIDDLDSKINLMQKAYDNLDAAKEGLKDVRSAIKKMPGVYDNTWKGKVAEEEIYATCKKDGSLYTSYTSYIDSIDEIQDALNLKLTALENERLEQKGILGKLAAIGNSLWTRIQNFFN